MTYASATAVSIRLLVDYRQDMKITTESLLTGREMLSSDLLRHLFECAAHFLLFLRALPVWTHNRSPPNTSFATLLFFSIGTEASTTKNVPRCESQIWRKK